MSNEVDEFLSGGGTKSAFGKDDPIGFSVTGTIESTEIRDQTDIQTGTVLTWDNGDVRKQMVVILKTDITDDEDDDGRRAVYVKGSKQIGSKSLHDAVRAAVQDAGAARLEVGGTLTISYIGSEPSKTKGFSDRKLWAGEYKAPDKAAQSGGFLGTDKQPAAEAAPVAAAPPAQAPAAAPPAAAAPAPAADPVARARELITSGSDDAAVAAETKLSPAVVAALRNSMPKPAADPQAEATARQLIGLGLDDKDIADSTGLTVDQVQALRNQAA